MVTYQAEHMYLTLNWEGVAGNSMAGEKWQIGLRITHRDPLTDTNAARWTQKTKAEIFDVMGNESTALHDIDYGFDANATALNQQAAIYTKASQKDIFADAHTFANDMKALICPTWRYVGAKLYPYNPAVLTDKGSPKALTAPSVAAVKVPIVGTATGIPLPPQNAAAVTLLTTARGRGSKGRVYLGGLSSNTMTTGGLMLSTYQNNFNNHVKALCNNLNNAPGIDPIYGPAVVVWHRKDNSFSRVIGVSTGNVMDTQRRRRRQLEESYVEVSTLDSGTPAQVIY